MGLGFHGAKGGLLDRGRIATPLPFRHVIRLSAMKGGFFVCKGADAYVTGEKSHRHP